MPNADIDVNKILAEAVKSSTKDVYNALKNKFFKEWKDNESTKKFGFPQSEYQFVAENIQKIGKEIYFKRLETCLGKEHWALNYIKVGLSISILNDKGDREKINKLRKEIAKTKGREPLIIVKMGSTGAIRGIIEHLDSLRINKGYKREAIISEFEEIRREWGKITIFVDRNQNNISIIKKQIKSKIKNKLPLFFVFSYGFNANNAAMKAIAELRNKKEIEPKDYLFDCYPNFDAVNTKIYMWSFTLVE